MVEIADSGIARLEKYEQSQRPEKRVSGREYEIKWKSEQVNFYTDTYGSRQIDSQIDRQIDR